MFAKKIQPNPYQPNIFQKMGDIFAKAGSGGNPYNPQTTSRADKMQLASGGLQQFAQQMQLLGALQSGRTDQAALIQSMIKQKAVDRQNQELGDSAYEAVIQAGGTKEQAELARRNPNLASQIVAGSFNKNSPSSSELINQKKVATLNLIKNLPGKTFEAKIEELKKYPDQYGIYKNYIEKQDATSILDWLMGNEGGGTSSSRFQVDSYPVD